MNEIIRERINAEVNIVRIDPGAYDQRMRVMIAASEVFDVAWMAPGFGFNEHVNQNAFLSLNELLPRYAPITYATVPQRYWEASRINGNIYGVINYQIMALDHGFFADQELMNRYGFNIEDFTSLDAIEPFLRAVKDNEPPHIIPFGVHRNGIWGDMATYYGFNGIASTPGVVRIGDSDFRVINQYETNEFVEHIATMRRFYQEGFIPADAAVITNFREMLGSGLVALGWNNNKPGGHTEVEMIFGNKPLYYVQVSPPMVRTSNLFATLSVISRTSRNPERSMEFLELINTDVELYNMISFGIEGRHFNKVGPNRIELIPDSGYFPNTAWMFGNQFNAFLLPGQPDDVWEQTIALNETAPVSEFLGFHFDNRDVINEVAQVMSVYNEFAPSLLTGSVDPDDVLPQFLDRMRGAGVDRIIEEKQRQLDEWVRENL